MNKHPQGFIAIYGGSFDPIHYAHSEIIRSLCENPFCWHIILMPNYANPLKTLPLFSAFDRLEMCKNLAQVYSSQYLSHMSLPKVIVSDYEVMQNKPTFSVQSVSVLKQSFMDKYPKAQFAFVLGSDSFAHLDKWYNIQTLCKIVKFIIVTRESIPIKDLNLNPKPQVIQTLDINKFNSLSSTQIRFLLQSGDIHKALEYIPEDIHSIIKRHFL